ncbi:PREDICTED: hematopoietic prostaglandin D synthase-like [Branchiostoma belcheri]|uniref:glutathione transferase n=1 Tax=Branchiostoma belcheri TaxID=7741 RepID=A0A6P5ANG9_BRABE|nr:PREDICTED: hematopoietic prostaglandin D synthase-like [Branchiostoma belcheri]
MPAYKLTYFNGRGTAEIVRLVFAAAGIEYEDVRIEKPEEQWPEFKPKTPMGQVPILEVDGTMLCQSNSIARYVAKVAGLAGKTPLDQARVDMIMDGMEDVGKKGNATHWEKDEEKKAEKKKEYEETFLPQFYTCLNKLVGDSGHFVGNELTLADITFFNTTDLVGRYFKLPSMDQFSGLKKVMDHVTSNPGIAKWLKERPETPF